MPDTPLLIVGRRSDHWRPPPRVVDGGSPAPGRRDTNAISGRDAWTRCSFSCEPEASPSWACWSRRTSVNTRTRRQLPSMRIRRPTAYRQLWLLAGDRWCAGNGPHTGHGVRMTTGSVWSCYLWAPMREISSRGSDGAWHSTAGSRHRTIHIDRNPQQPPTEPDEVRPLRCCSLQWELAGRRRTSSGSVWSSQW